MKVSLSIIVTVYNCEQYLKRCFDSLIKQTYAEFEIVIVDDGSTDDSASICDEFAAERANVRVIHKPNGGTVSARKTGIVHANGTVVGFIDGDDWVDPDFCERLLHPFRENDAVDVVSSGLMFEYVSAKEKDYVLIDGAAAGFYTARELEQKILPKWICDPSQDSFTITTSICCKMVRRSVAMAAMSAMDEALTFGEDGAYVLAVLVEAQGIYVLDQAYYHYEQHADSQNYKYEISAYGQLVKLQQCMNRIASKADLFQILRPQIESYIQTYLRKIAGSVFQINEDGRIYLFPSELVVPGSHVLIHGAGMVGRQYVKYVKRSHKYHLVAWTDKNEKRDFAADDIPCSLEEISQFQYDYVILAANSEYILQQMKEDMRKYNIPEERILAAKPVSYRI